MTDKIITIDININYDEDIDIKLKYYNLKITEDSFKNKTHPSDYYISGTKNNLIKFLNYCEYDIADIYPELI